MGGWNKSWGLQIFQKLISEGGGDYSGTQEYNQISHCLIPLFSQKGALSYNIKYV